MVRKVHGTNRPWYEKSTNGTKRLWYEKSMVRKVWLPLQISDSRVTTVTAVFKRKLEVTCLIPYDTPIGCYRVRNGRSSSSKVIYFGTNRNYYKEYSSLWHSISKLAVVSCHAGSHSVICHPTQVNTTVPQPERHMLDLSIPEGTKGWVDLKCHVTNKRSLQFWRANTVFICYLLPCGEWRWI